MLSRPSADAAAPAARPSLKLLFRVHPVPLPRYMKEHTALALGLVAVLIVAIVMATKLLELNTASGYEQPGDS